MAEAVLGEAYERADLDAWLDAPEDEPHPPPWAEDVEEVEDEDDDDGVAALPPDVAQLANIFKLPRSEE